MIKGLRPIVWCNFHCDEDLGKCSAVNLTFDLCNRLHEYVKGHSHYFGPTTYSKLKLPKKFFASPNISVIPYGPSQFYKFRSNIPNEALDAIHPEKASTPAYDLVLTRDTFTASWFKFALARRIGAWTLPVDIPVVTMVQESIDEHGIPQCDQMCGWATQIASFMTSDMLLMASECEKKLALDLCRRFLLPSQISSIDSKMKVVPNPVDLSRIRDRHDEMVAARKKRREGTDKINVFHGGTFEGKRNLPDCCRGLDNLNPKYFKRVKLVISAQTTACTLSCKNIVLDARLGQNQEQYYENMKDGDICLIPSIRQTAGVGYHEVVESGMIPIFMDAPWIWERIPKDFPFVMKSIEKDLPALVNWIINNEDKAHEIAATCRESMRRWDTQNCVPEYAELLYDVAETNRQARAEELFAAVGGKYIKKAIKESGEELVGYSSLLKLASSLAKADGVATLRSFSPLALRWMLLHEHYRDDGGEVPIFRRMT